MKHLVAYADEIRPGECKVVSVDGRFVALFNIDGAFYATSNACPHKGGPLGDGQLFGNLVKCPWHEWKFNVATGECVGAPEVKLERYQVDVKNEQVWLSA